MKNYKVLSIDAWADGDGWTWNNWFNIATYDEEIHGELNKENAYKFFFKEFGTSPNIIPYEEYSSKYEIDDDQYNLVLVRKDNQKPLLAIEYGSQN
jgi:hypothetical protein